MFPDDNWDDIELVINGDREINAYAGGGKMVQINLALAELISDSESELAFVIAHELGHINQQRTRNLTVWADNAEFDADAWGLMLSLAGGFDPYAASGALAKLEMASGRAGLLTQFEQQMSADVHKSFNTRLQNVYDLMVAVCGLTPANKAACDGYKDLFHPHLPDAAPLKHKPTNPVMAGKSTHSRAVRSNAVPLN
jgi:Zn-dependent protease with chaperone function